MRPCARRRGKKNKALMSLRPSIFPRRSKLVFCACTRSGDIEGSGGNGIVPNAEALQKAEQVADKVRQKARRSEKAEASQDLIEDKVHVKTTAEGEPVIEQTGEASRYAKRFQGK